MSYLLAAPSALADVAAELEGIGSTLSLANADAANRISGMTAAASDEVSTAIASLFGGYGQDYRAAANQAAAFHTQFQQALTAAGNAYAAAEATIAAGLQSTLAGPAPLQPQATIGMIPPFPANEVTLFLSGTGNPIPSQSHITRANNNFVRSVGTLLGLPTPEELYPVTGVRSLPFDASVQQGLTILDQAIYDQITGGKTVTVYGVSQSAVIAALEMRSLAAGTSLFGANPPDANQLNFVLTANEMAPNGGMLSRFPGITLPGIGLTFYGAMPSDTPYPVANYTLQYDGFADFPRYPLNVVSNLNAMAGILYVHSSYLSLTPDQVNGAIQLPTSPGYDGNTKYYMIPTEQLPLLRPFRSIPVIGNPFVELIEPTVKVVVNLGYGDPNYGYSTGYADVPTPFGLFPDVPPQAIANALIAGGHEGVQNFNTEVQLLATRPVATPALPTAADVVRTVTGFPSPARIVNTAASIISTDYAVLLPTADMALSLTTTLPLYSAQLFTEQLAQGNLINAIGYPIAGSVGLISIGAGLELMTITSALRNNVSDIQSLIP